MIVQNDFLIDKGKKNFDLLPFADSTFFAISQPFKDLLEAIGITGYESFPINIEGNESKYYGIFIKSFAGPILNLEALNNYETEETEFDVSTWDGSDIFSLEDTLLIVCTTRVKDLIESNKLSNIELRPL